ncbi:IclR family transcriptional regulator [Loktanella sp. M215]|uniref:IclR family transcriptional regulator n=1 Tax=Loktanella sp. M215 TaxID=2675431 RepID=UPI001F1884E2|nr:IclR family transcriptional regulator [Loktanella sp. M215]
MKETGPSKFVPAVENAIKLLRRIAMASEPEGVAAMARATGLNGSTTFNILKTLANEGFVTFDEKDKTYRIGMGVLEIVGSILGANPNDLIRPLLNALATEHSVLIALWQITECDRIVLIDSVAPHKTVHAKLETGSRLPAMIGAVGRCYAALTGVTRGHAQAAYDRLKWQSPPGFEAYWEDIETARVTGFAFDFGNLFIGLNIAAAVVCDADGRPRLGLSAISIAGQTSAEAMQDIATALHKAANLIETNVFARPR